MSNTQKLIKIGAIALAISIIISIVSFAMSSLSWLFYQKENAYDFSDSYKNVKEIEIDGIASAIEIIAGNKFKVDAENLDDKLKIRLKDNVLKIEEKGNIFKNGFKDGNIYITIPKDIILDELSIDTGAGSFKIKDVSIKDFELDHGAGVLEIDNVNFYSADIDGGAGKIEIKDSKLNDLDLDAGAGKVEIEAVITGNSKVNCGIGEVDITLLGNKDSYQVTTEKGIGSIKIDGIVQKNSTIYGNGNDKLQIEGGIGSIEVSFK